MKPNREIEFPVPDLLPVWLSRCLEPQRELQVRTQLSERRFWDYLTGWSEESLYPMFVELAPYLTDLEYWTLLRQIWGEVVTGRPSAVEWLRLFSCGRSQRQHLMTVADRLLLAQLPSTVKVYGAGPRSDGLPSLSWMLDPDVAVLRAARFVRLRDHSPKIVPVRKVPLTVAVGTCSRQHVLAVHTRDGERSIIIDPAWIRLKPAHLWLRAQ